MLKQKLNNIAQFLNIQLLGKPWIMALFLAFLSFLLIPHQNRYIINEVENRELAVNQAYIYEDLNNDGISEKIIFQQNEDKYYNFIVWQQNKVVGQWVLSGRLHHQHHFIFEDYDKNGWSEIYVVSTKQDSFLLDAIEPFSKTRIIEGLLVGKGFQNEGRNISSCTNLEWINSKKGSNNLIVTLYSGYSGNPRKQILVDVNTCQVKESSSFGANFETVIGTDINGDGDDEIFGRSNAYYNVDDSIYLTDKYAWFYYLNNDLSFAFEPKIIGISPAEVQVKPLIHPSDTSIFVLYSHKSAADTTHLAKYDRSGKLLKKIKSPELHGEGNLVIDNKEPAIYLLFNDGYVLKYDINLNLLGKNNTPPIYRISFIHHIINRRPEKYIILGVDRKYYLFDHNFNHYQQLDIPTKNSVVPYFSIKQNANGNQQLVYSNHDKCLTYQIKKNPLGWFPPLIILLAFLPLWGILWFLSLGQKRILERRYQSSQKIAELQIKSLHNQLDPHFTLNLLNSIGSLFAAQKTEEANYYFGKYAKLLREMVLTSDRIDISLQDELDYCKTYLQLEQIRLNNAFDFSFDIDEKANTKIIIPRLLTHTFIENAVKHGIRHLDGRKGKITIKVEMTKRLKITIEDNGIGRQKSKTYSSMSTGKGLEIIDETIKHYNSIKKSEIKYAVIDIYNENQDSLGTKVQIEMNA